MTLSEKAVVVLLAGLVTIQSIVYAAPCYTRTATAKCTSQGGPGCTVIAPVPALPCPGGPWTVADAVVLGLDLGDPCDNTYIDHTIPKDFSVGGNQPSGYLSQGTYTFQCTSEVTCTRTLVVPIPVTYSCIANPLIPCSSHSVFTAGGAPCTGTGT